MTYYRPPAIYQRDRERRERAARAQTERQARAGQQRITDMIEQQGGKLSDAGREFLTGLAQAFRDIAAGIKT